MNLFVQQVTGDWAEDLAEALEEIGLKMVALGTSARGSSAESIMWAFTLPIVLIKLFNHCWSLLFTLLKIFICFYAEVAINDVVDPLHGISVSYIAFIVCYFSRPCRFPSYPTRQFCVTGRNRHLRYLVRYYVYTHTHTHTCAYFLAIIYYSLLKSG